MPDTPLFPTLIIPSRVLQRHNIEILLTTLNVDVGPLNPTTSTFRPKDAVLVPAIRTPTSATGRYTGITYPVHAALLLGDGIPSAVAYGRFTAAQPAHEFGSELVKLAVTAPAPESEPSQDPAQKYATVDLALASMAIAKFRETVDNAVVYERGWFRSGMPALADWLHARCVAEPERLKPAVQSLVSSFLADTAAAVAEAEAQLEAELQAARIPEETVSALFSALDVWAENAHTELLEVLDTAFASAAWRRIRWWKLLWRVDDVGYVASDILNRSWLVDAEKDAAFLGGRLKQAGFLRGVSDASFRNSSAPADKPEENQSETGNLSLAVPASGVAVLESSPSAASTLSPDPPPKEDERTAAASSLEGVIPPSTPPSAPWPLHIPLARRTLHTTTVATLQARAQALLVGSLATASGSGALSALLYVSSVTGGYEAGAVAAAGAVWAARRLVKGWEGARRSWEGEVREEGRRAVKETEGWVRGVVVGRGRDRGEDELVRVEREEVQRAREVVVRAKEALETAERE